MARCCVCGRERPEDAGHKLDVTDEERVTLVRMLGAGNIPDSLFYCDPCWRTLADRRAGASLQRGFTEAWLRACGDNAETARKKAARIHDRLVGELTEGKRK